MKKPHTKAAKDTTKILRLDERQLAVFHDQILIVLADYQNTELTETEKLTDEHGGTRAFGFCRTSNHSTAGSQRVRCEVARRILANLEVIAK